MNKLTLTAGAVCLALTGLVASAEDKAPMPQTRGMQGMDPKLHDAGNRPTVTCTPKPGTEKMTHEPKDHPMPGTRGMQGMDPAQHMQDCESSDKALPFERPIHQHK